MLKDWNSTMVDFILDDLDSLSLDDRQLLSSDMSEQQRQQILVLLYLAILGCCCLTPCLYGLHSLVWRRQQERRLRQVERNAILAAMQQSNHYRSEDHEAIRSERHARIIQLLEPVRMVLKEGHFVDAPSPPESPTEFSEEGSPVDEMERAERGEVANRTIQKSTLKRNKHVGEKVSFTERDDCPSEISVGKDENMAQFDFEEESTFIRIPRPGLELNIDDPIECIPTKVEALKKMRTVPGFCTICLCGFHSGSEIVWSSNAECEHVFHRECMEQWLMKLRGGEGPICPCCRRDFIVDPYDLYSSSCDETISVDPERPRTRCESQGEPTSSGSRQRHEVEL